MREASFSAVVGELLFVIAIAWLIYTGAARALIEWLFSFQFWEIVNGTRKKRSFI
jgi:hypothetical protein